MKSFLFLACAGWMAHGFAIEWPESSHPYGISAADPRLEELSKGLSMPPVSESGLVQTFNFGGGYMIADLDAISSQFVEFAKGCSGPVLEIGSAFGVATIPALQQSNCCVIADDIGKENLLVLRKQADERDRDRLYLNAKRFPQELEFAPNSIEGVLTCRMIHFLRGEDIEEGFRKVFDWLVPGGKFFIVTCSPYLRNLKEFIPNYEERWAKGVSWPGYVEEFTKVTNDAYSNLRPFFHVMDERPLKSALQCAGFDIEEIRFIDRGRAFPDLALDGRELIGVVAVKPKCPKTAP